MDLIDYSSNSFIFMKKKLLFEDIQYILNFYLKNRPNESLPGCQMKSSISISWLSGKKITKDSNETQHKE